MSSGQVEDRFSCSSETEHVYDWAFHAPGSLAVSISTEPFGGALGERNGYQHVTGVARGVTGDAWSAVWTNGGTKMTLTFKPVPGTEVFTGVGPGRDPSDKVPVLVVRRRASHTVFDAVHSFERGK